MSTWTHVVGCIRIDGIPALGHRKQDVIDALGPICTYDDWHNDSTLPRGSEGGLQYEVIEYDSGLRWLCIPIWGDLRDYEDTAEIETWWNKLLPKLGMVRDAVLHIQVEGREATVLTFKECK